MLSNQQQQELWIQNFDSWLSNSWTSPTYQTTDTQWTQSNPLDPLPANASAKAQFVKPVKPTKSIGKAAKPTKVQEHFPPPTLSPESFYMLQTQTPFEAPDNTWKQYASPSELAPAQPNQYDNSWSSPTSVQSPTSSPPASPTKMAAKPQLPQNPRSKRNLDIETELSKQNLYKTELCRSWMETGACPYSTKCQFAHGRDELRPVKRHPKYKTEICRTFHTTGTCPYGKRCRFIHDPAERSVSPALTQMEADALEQDIQRQLAALRLSLENPTDPGSVEVAPALDLLETEDGEDNDNDDDSDVDTDESASQIPSLTPPKVEEVEPVSKIQKGKGQTNEERKKARLPFFQKLLSKKH